MADEGSVWTTEQTINNNLVRKFRSIPDMEAHVDTVAGDRFVIVCDVQNIYHQIPVPEGEQDKDSFRNGKRIMGVQKSSIRNSKRLILCSRAFF